MTSTGSEEPNSHSPESIITLNVGGKIFQTTLQTLTTPIPYHDNAEEDEVGVDFSKEEQEHLLRTMFLNKEFDLQRDKDGNVFIDRDPDIFKYILEFLRCEGMTSLFQIPHYMLYSRIATEAKYFGLVKLEEIANGTYIGAPVKSPSVVLHDSGSISPPKPFENNHWKQLYLASRDGFSSKAFHEKCDDQGPTLVCIVVFLPSNHLNTRTFGGILEGSWSSNNEVVNGRHSKVYNGAWYSKKRSTPAAFSHAEYGPIFGASLEDFDLKVDGSMKELQVSSSGKCYHHVFPNDFHKYTIKNVEVFALGPSSQTGTPYNHLPFALSCNCFQVL